MVINTDKTKLMLITSRQKRYNLKNTDLSLNFSGADLKLTSNEKVLGIHIDENLLWISNISQRKYHPIYGFCHK